MELRPPVGEKVKVFYWELRAEGARRKLGTRNEKGLGFHVQKALWAEWAVSASLNDVLYQNIALFCYFLYT